MLQKVCELVKRVPITLRYGILLLSGVIALKTLEYQLFSFKPKSDLLLGLYAVFFVLIGVACARIWQQRNEASHNTDDLQVILTHREKNLLDGLSRGCTYLQLADENCVSINTVKTHMRSLYKKLNVDNRNAAVAAAKALNLL